MQYVQYVVPTPNAFLAFSVATDGLFQQASGKGLLLRSMWVATANKDSGSLPTARETQSILLWAILANKLTYVLAIECVRPHKKKWQKNNNKKKKKVRVGKHWGWRRRKAKVMEK